MMTTIETAPVMDLRPQDVEDLVDELQAYHALYSPLFQRRDQRQWSAEYLRGLLLEIPRKSIEPMMLSLHGADRNAIRAMQQFVGEGAWNDDAILKQHWREVDATLGDEDGVLTLDGSDFLDEVASSGLWYFAEVPHDTRVWLERPLTEIPECSGRGRKPIRERLVEGQHEAQTVKAMAEQVVSTQWQRHWIKEGSKGPMAADFWAMRVVAVREGLLGPEVWLVLRRQIETGEFKTYLCNAPSQNALSTLARISGMRWPVETCFKESKQYLGMGDYEVRSWRGWHHHMTLCILAHFFLVRQQQRLKKTSVG